MDYRLDVAVSDCFLRHLSMRLVCEERTGDGRRRGEEGAQEDGHDDIPVGEPPAQDIVQQRADDRDTQQQPRHSSDLHLATRLHELEGPDDEYADQKKSHHTPPGVTVEGMLPREAAALGGGLGDLLNLRERLVGNLLLGEAAGVDAGGHLVVGLGGCGDQLVEVLGHGDAGRRDGAVHQPEADAQSHEGNDKPVEEFEIELAEQGFLLFERG